MRKISAAFVAIIVGSLMLSACANTVTGVGKDVKSTGHALKRAVN
jgi:predicted small secreted protein